jgi:hypothetical protein
MASAGWYRSCQSELGSTSGGGSLLGYLSLHE